MGACVNGSDDTPNTTTTTSTTMSIDDHIKSREDLQQRLDSKSMLGEYCGVLYSVASPMCCDETMLEYLFNTYNVDTRSSTSTSNNSSSNNSNVTATTVDDLYASELVELLAKYCPYVSVVVLLGYSSI